MMTTEPTDDTLDVDDTDRNANWIKRTADLHAQYPGLLPEDLEPMTPEQIAEVRAQRK